MLCWFLFRLMALLIFSILFEYGVSHIAVNSIRVVAQSLKTETILCWRCGKNWIKHSMNRAILTMSALLWHTLHKDLICYNIDSMPSTVHTFIRLGIFLCFFYINRNPSAYFVRCLVQCDCDANVKIKCFGKQWLLIQMCICTTALPCLLRF